MCFPNWIAPVSNLALGEFLHLSNCIYLTQNRGGMAVSQDPKKATEKHHKEPYSALVYHITLERPVSELFLSRVQTWLPTSCTFPEMCVICDLVTMSTHGNGIYQNVLG